METKEKDIVFDKTIFKVGGGSYGVIIPPELLDKLELDVGTKVKLLVDSGKHGLYLALWNPAQQKK